MQTKQELLQFVGIMLLFIGLFSLVQSPTLGIFKLGILQEFVYITSGIFSIYLTFQKNRQRFCANFLMLLFGVLAVLNFVLHGSNALPVIAFQIANAWFCLFLTGVFAYIAYGRAYQKHYSIA